MVTILACAEILTGKVMEQITALGGVVHSVLAQKVQQQNAAAPQLRATAEGGYPLRNEQHNVTERPRAALQHNEVIHQSCRAAEWRQQSVRGP